MRDDIYEMSLCEMRFNSHKTSSHEMRFNQLETHLASYVKSLFRVF